MNIYLKYCMFFIVTGLITTVVGCTKTIQVNLNDADPQLIIEGKVLDTTGPYYVKLSNSVNFSASNTFPPVSGAIISITDQTAQLTDHLAETVPGTYATDSLEGVPGHIYQLRVNVGGVQYTAISQMPEAVKLDSVTFQKFNAFGDETIFAVTNFQDPAGIKNYYTFVEFINGKQYNKATFVFDDRLSDGKYISQQLFTDSAYIQKGDAVSLQMNGVDKGVYTYFNTLLTAGDPQAGTPANPVSNITGDKKVLGYFSAQTSFTMEGTVTSL